MGGLLSWEGAIAVVVVVLVVLVIAILWDSKNGDGGGAP